MINLGSLVELLEAGLDLILTVVVTGALLGVLIIGWKALWAEASDKSRALLSKVSK